MPFSKMALMDDNLSYDIHCQKRILAQPPSNPCTLSEGGSGRASVQLKAGAACSFYRRNA